jgi:hypothetical protein
MKRKVSMSINRVTSNQRTDFVQISIGCGTSHARVLDIDLELHELALLITGRSLDHLEGEWSNLKVVGKYLESKMCEVRLSFELHRALQTFGDEPTMEEKNEFAKILHEHEADGFRNQAALTTFQNPHKYAADENEMVAQIRYVRWVDEPVADI